MARDGDLSLAVLQGVGPSPVGFLSALSVGALALIAYSRCGRTKAQKSGVNAVLDSSQKDLRTTTNKRIAVFAASLQWADAVKAVSRGAPRSRRSVTCGIRWSVSASEKDGESEGRFSTVMHEHLLGFICTSHFPALAQPEESEERRWLDWDRGTPLSRHLQKGKQNHRARRLDHLYITEKVMGQ